LHFQPGPNQATILSRELLTIPIQPGKNVQTVKISDSHICGEGTEAGENSDNNRFF